MNGVFARVRRFSVFGESISPSVQLGLAMSECEVGQLRIRENPIKNGNLANYVELCQPFCECLVGLEDSTAPYEDEPRKAKTGWWKPYPAEDKSRTDEVGQLHIRENPIKNRNLANYAELCQPFCECLVGLEDSTAPYDDEPRKAKTG